jgi:hypothetical protein
MADQDVFWAAKIAAANTARKRFLLLLTHRPQEMRSELTSELSMLEAKGAGHFNREWKG